MDHSEQPGVAPRDVSKHDRRFSRRIALGAIGVVGAGLALAAAGTVFADTGTTTTTTTSTAGNGRPGFPGGGRGPRGFGGGPQGGPGPMGGPGFGPRGGLTVSAISGSTITAKRPDGTTETIAVNGSTAYTVAGLTGSLSDVQVGRRIHAVGTVSNNTLTATHVDVLLPRLSGVVASVSGSTITVKDRAGATKTITVTASTAYQRAGATISLTDIRSNSQVDAAGALNSDGSLTARVVRVILPAVDGAVTAVSGSTITVQGRGPNAGPKTVTVSGSTTYTTGGPGATASANLSNVKVGDNIHAEGTLASDGSLQALAVHIALPAVDGQVTAVSGNTITVQGRGPNTSAKTVTVNSSTTYTVGDPQSSTASSLGNVTVGAHIHATGTLNSDGSLTATSVAVLPAPMG